MDLEIFTNPNYSIDNNMRTSKSLIQYGQITDNQGTDFNHYVEFPSPTTPAFITSQIPETSPTKTISTKEFSAYNLIFNKKETLIQLIMNLSWSTYVKHHLGNNINANISNNDICSFSYFARTAGEGLYFKQTAAYEIMCSSYILKSMELYDLFNDDMQQKIQNMFGEDT